MMNQMNDARNGKNILAIDARFQDNKESASNHRLSRKHIPIVLQRIKTTMNWN